MCIREISGLCASSAVSLVVVVVVGHSSSTRGSCCSVCHVKYGIYS